MFKNPGLFCHIYTPARLIDATKKYSVNIGKQNFTQNRWTDSYSEYKKKTWPVCNATRWPGFCELRCWAPISNLPHSRRDLYSFVLVNPIPGIYISRLTSRNIRCILRVGKGPDAMHYSLIKFFPNPYRRNNKTHMSMQRHAKNIAKKIITQMPYIYIRYLKSPVEFTSIILI